MSKTRIEWTDTTWNPVVGCTRASAGCDNCYAVTMTRRLEAMGQEKYAGLVNVGKKHFNGVVRTVEDALLLPLSWKKPRKVFVNSMSDLFHKDVPFHFIDKVFAVMALTPQHTYQVLTKRPDRMAQYLNDRLQPGAGETTGVGRISFISTECYRILEEGGECDPDNDANWTESGSHRRMGWGWPLPNVWLGTSCENQETADERIPHLLNCPAAVRFLSCEPLLGAVDLTKVGERNPCTLPGQPVFVTRLNTLTGRKHHVQSGADMPTGRIHWVIVGGESGHGARPMHPDWVRSLRDQCEAAGVPFFFKQWGAWAPGECGSDKPCTRSELGAWERNGEWITRLVSPSEHETMYCDDEPDVYRFGKKVAGRLLDGRTWDEFPEVAR